jgi:hypothetical protein
MSARCKSAMLPALAAISLVACVPSAHAQAWVPSRGEGSVSVLFQDMTARFHRLPVEELDRGEIRSDALVFDVTYGLTDRVAIDISLPVISAKYTGAFPHQPDLALDDGQRHAAFQDFRFALRYNVRAGRFAVTPFLGSIVPSHNYAYFAHSAVGRRLNEVQVGAYVARLLDPLLPGAFVQGRYSYGFTERVLDIAHDRSNADLEVGYFLTEKARVFGLASGQYTHGGLDMTPESRSVLPTELWTHHDQIDRQHYLNLGGGGSVSLSDSTDLFASVLTNVAGRNGHSLSRSINLGVTWTFSRRRDNPRTASRSDGESRSLIRCLCEKGG